VWCEICAMRSGRYLALFGIYEVIYSRCAVEVMRRAY